MRKYKLNENYFKELDTPEKAYILGFLYSDGYISQEKNGYVISVGQIKDRKDIIYKINKCLESEKPVIVEERNKTLFYKIVIYSKTIYKDLLKLGLIPHKSLTIEFPNYIPDNLLSHFIRGLFDGDGCVWNGKRKEMYVKDNSRSSGYRKRIVHNVKFTYTGNITFVSQLQKTLMRVLGFKQTKLNFSKSKNPNNNTSSEVCTMEYSGRKQLKKFYDYIYKDCTICVESKKLKFEEIFLCSNEEIHQ